MGDKPLETVFSYVERAYMRLQAGDVLIRCLEDGSLAPIQEMVQGLVLAGPQSLGALREVLAEVGQRKSQVQDDLHQIVTEMRRVLKSYGVNMQLEDSDLLPALTPFDLLSVMREQGILEQETQTACLHVLQDSRELLNNLGANLRLLVDIEAYLRDWLWGLAYESIHWGSEGPLRTSGPAF